MITAAAVSTTLATALSTYLVRTVNLRLLRDDESLSASERSDLIKIGHRVNSVRLLAIVGASLALRQISRGTLAQPS